ncbi:MAG: hypothetical protein WC791_00865 [Candidatus Paceibacterota bacterium]|jgi:hypothetical protein
MEGAPQFKSQETHKNSFEKLSEVMKLLSSEVNSTVKNEYGLRKLVDEEGRIRADRFELGESGGIYTTEEIEEDQRLVDSQNRHNSGADDPSTQDFFKKQYGIPGTPESVVEQYLKNKDAQKSNQAEMAITALLHKILKDRFIVVRASTFDDYMHGMDNLILDRETGAVICAFDEVLRNEGDEPGPSKKLDKIKNHARNGGRKAKYGIALEDGELVRSPLENVPVFFLELKSNDLNELANDLLENYDNEPTKFEQALFTHLVSSIKEQKGILEKLPLPQVMKNKLKAFEESLGVLEGVISNQS